MNSRLVLAAIVVLGSTHGCATTNDPAVKGPQEDGIFITGSRLPQKTTGTAPVSQTSREGWEDATRGHKQINPQGN